MKKLNPIYVGYGLKFLILMTLFYLTVTAPNDANKFEMLKMFFAAAATFSVDVGKNQYKKHKKSKQKTSTVVDDPKENN